MITPSLHCLCLAALLRTACLVSSFSGFLHRSRPRVRRLANHWPFQDQQVLNGSVFQPRFRHSTLWDRISRTNDLEDIVAIEKQVIATAQAKLDANLILEALDANEASRNAGPLQGFDSTYKPMTLDPWKIALAASLLCSGAAFMMSTYNLLLTFIVGLAVFAIALADPVDDNSIAGALARMVGRITIQSVEASQPKVKAVARAVVTGQDELVQLRQRVKELESENAHLMRWKEQRTRAEECLGDFSLSALKEQARAHKLPVGGTKMQLLMRLVDAGVIEL